VGCAAAIIGLRSLIQVVFYQRDWMERFRSYEESAVQVEGRIVNKSKTEDNITHCITYSVTIEYDGSIVSSSLKEEMLVQKTFDTASLAAKELYELASFAHLPSVEMKLAPGQPNSGVPALLLRRKQTDFYFWAECGHPCGMVSGISLYLLAALWSGGMFDWVPFCLTVALAFLLLILPLLLFYAKHRHEWRLEKLMVNPMTIETETDPFRTFWVALGPTAFKKTAALMFAAGMFVMFVFSIFGFAFGIAGLFTLINSLVYWPRKKKFFQSFRENIISVPGTLTKQFALRGKYAARKYFVTYQYDAPNDTVMKATIQSEGVHKEFVGEQGNRSIDVLLLKGHPKSGIPAIELDNAMATPSCCALWIGRPLGILAGFGGYIGFAYYLYGSGQNWTTRECMDFAAILLAGLLMVAPQLYIWSKNLCQRDIQFFLERAKFLSPENPTSIDSLVKMEDDMTVSTSCESEMEMV
jgi:hypothetical protein